MRRDRTDEYEKRQDELAHAIRERDENFQKYVDANEALLKAREDLEKRIAYAAEIEEFLMQEAEQRGYQRGVEDAAGAVQSKFSAHGWNYHLPSVGREMAAAKTIERITRERDEARAEEKRLRKRLGELDADEDAGDWLYKYEAEALEAKAEARGYRKGVEDAAGRLDDVLEARRRLGQFSVKIGEASEAYHVLANVHASILALLEKK